jgi:C-terminal processing protease CtpA/Prc
MRKFYSYKNQELKRQKHSALLLGQKKPEKVDALVLDLRYISGGNIHPFAEDL